MAFDYTIHINADTSAAKSEVKSLLKEISSEAKSIKVGVDDNGALQNFLQKLQAISDTNKNIKFDFDLSSIKKLESEIEKTRNLIDGLKNTSNKNAISAFKNTYISDMNKSISNFASQGGKTIESIKKSITGELGNLGKTILNPDDLLASFSEASRKLSVTNKGTASEAYYKSYLKQLSLYKTYEKNISTLQEKMQNPISNKEDLLDTIKLLKETEAIYKNLGSGKKSAEGIFGGSYDLENYFKSQMTKFDFSTVGKSLQEQVAPAISELQESLSGMELNYNNILNPLVEEIEAAMIKLHNFEVGITPKIDAESFISELTSQLEGMEVPVKVKPDTESFAKEVETAINSAVVTTGGTSKASSSVSSAIGEQMIAKVSRIYEQLYSQLYSLDGQFVGKNVVSSYNPEAYEETLGIIESLISEMNTLKSLSGEELFSKGLIPNIETESVSNFTNGIEKISSNLNGLRDNVLSAREEFNAKDMFSMDASIQQIEAYSTRLQSSFTEVVSNIKTQLQEIKTATTESVSSNETGGTLRENIQGQLEEPFTIKINTEEIKGQVESVLSESEFPINVVPEESSLGTIKETIASAFSGTEGELGSSASSSISGIEAIVTRITDSVRLLSEEYQRNQQTLQGVVDSEVSNFEYLDGSITILKESLSTVKSVISEIPTDGLESLSVLNELSPKKNIGANLTSIAEGIDALRTSLSGGFQSGELDIFTKLSEILQYGDQLKDLATVLQSSAKQIKKAREEIATSSSEKESSSNTEQYKKDAEYIQNAISLYKQYAKYKSDLLSNKTSSNSELEQAPEIFQRALEIAKNYGDTLAEDSSEAKKLAESISEIQNLNFSKTDYSSMIDSTISKYEKLVSSLGKKNLSPEYSSVFDSLSSSLEKLKTVQSDISNNAFTGTTEQIEQMISVLNEAESAFTRLKEAKTNALTAADPSKITSAYAEIAQILQKNTNMSSELRAKFEEVGQALNEMYKNGGSKLDFSKQISQLNMLKQEMYSTGQAGSSFMSLLGNQMGRTLRNYISFYTNIFYLSMKVKEIVENIVDLDDALVDLKKTTTMNSTQLNDFYYSASDVAKEMGVTTEEIISQAAAWSRLGYSSAEASTQMAKLSSQFSSISPGMDTDTAQEGLVSIMKAFDIDTEDVESEIMDKINIIGNNFAVTNEDIVEGLERSSSSMAAANNTLSESIAIFTGANEIVQNAESVGTALKTITMRIRGYDEETEEISADYENLTGEIADLTKTAKTPGGISLFTDASKTTYKSTYEILKDIHEIWGDLTDKNQAQILDKLFGKRNAQVGSSLLSNFEQVDAALEKMDESAGSADREMGIIQESLSYKVNAIKETWTGIFQSLATRSSLGNIFDGITKISEAIGFVTKNIGLLGVALTGIGIYSGVKGQNVWGLFNGSANSIQSFFTQKSVAKLNGNVISNRDYNAIQKYNSFMMANSGQYGSMDKYEAARMAYTKYSDEMTESTRGATAAFASEGKAISGVTTQTRAAALGMNVLNTAINAGIMMLVSVGLQAGITALEEAFTSVQEAADNASDAVTTYQDSTKTLAENKETVAGLKDEYEELIKGVNTNTNANITLSTDEYERFLEINNQIADMFPSLVSGYDAEGNAILDLAEGYDSLTEAMRSSSEEAASTLLYGDTSEKKKDRTTFDDVAKNFWNNSTGVNGNYSNNNFIENLAGLFGKNFGYNKIGVSKTLNESLDDLQGYMDAVDSGAQSLDDLRNAGVDISNVVSQLQEEGYDVEVADLFTSTKEDQATILKNVSDTIQKLEAQKQEALAQVKESASAALELDDIYKGFVSKEETTQQDMAEFFASNMTEAQATEIASSNNPTQALRDYINDLTSTIKDASQLYTDAYESITAATANPGDVTGVELENIKAYADLLTNLPGFDQSDIYEMFGVDKLEETDSRFRQICADIKDVESSSKSAGKTSKKSQSDSTKATAKMAAATKQLSLYQRTLTNDQKELFADAYEEGMDLTQAISAYESALSGSFLDLKADIISVQDLIDDTSSKLSQMASAAETDNAGKSYDEVIDYISTAKELAEAGDIGTDDFKSIASFFSPTGADDLDNWLESVQKAERYFTSDSLTGVVNLLTDLSNAGFGTFTSDGQWSSMITSTKDVEKAADSLGISYESLMVAFGELEDKGFYNDFYDSTQDGYALISQLTTEQAEAQKELNDLEAQGYKQGDTVWDAKAAEIETYQTRIDSAVKSLSKLQELENYRNQNADGLLDRSELSQTDSEGNLVYEEENQQLVSYTETLNDYYNTMKSIVDDTSIDSVTKKTKLSALNAEALALRKDLEGTFSEDIVDDVYQGFDGVYDKLTRWGEEHDFDFESSVELDTAEAYSEAESLKEFLGTPAILTVEVDDSTPGGGTVSKVQEIVDDYTSGDRSGASKIYKTLTSDEKDFLAQYGADITNMDTLVESFYTGAVDEAKLALELTKEIGEEIDTINEKNDSDSSSKTKVPESDKTVSKTPNQIKSEVDNNTLFSEMLPEGIDATVHVSEEGADEAKQKITDAAQDQDATINVNVTGAVDSNVIQKQAQALSSGSGFSNNQASTVTVKANTSGADSSISNTQKNASSKQTMTVAANTSSAVTSINAVKKLASSKVTMPISAKVGSVRSEIQDAIKGPWNITVHASVTGLAQGTLQSKLANSPSIVARAKAKKMASEKKTSSTTMSVSQLFPHASGTSKNGVPEDQLSLVNEVGQESIVRDGVWQMIPGGPHTVALKKGDVVFNHLQTEELIKNGASKTRGRLIGGGFAQGTFDGMPAHASTGHLRTSTSPSGVGSSSTTSAASAAASAASSASSAADSVSDATTDLKDYIDWIEVKIDRIEADIEDAMTVAEGAWRSWSERSTSLASATSQLVSEVSTLKQASAKYYSEAESFANSVGLSQDYRDKVQNGKIDLETIDDGNDDTDDDQTLIDNIERYQEL